VCVCVFVWACGELTWRSFLSRPSLPQARGIMDNDVFTFNEDFTSKLNRIKIPMVSMKEATSQEEVSAASEAVPPSVEEDRRHL
jgi:hypothetical protein